MAENLQSLRKRIRTAENITQIAKAMEMIAASKIKKAQAAVLRHRPYAEKITYMLERALFNIDRDTFEHPYLRKSSSGKMLVVALSPDKGLAGSLPANLFRKLFDYREDSTYLVTIGKKIERFASRLNYNVVASFPMGTRFPSYSVIYPVIELINQYYLSGRVSEVQVMFGEFRSFFTQVPAAVRLLPIMAETLDRPQGVSYIFEPSPAAVLRDLLPDYIEIKLYNAFINAFTSEQAARMMAMQNAKENASDITHFLTRLYNKSRQAKITGEILDLANGQMAQSA